MSDQGLYSLRDYFWQLTPINILGNVCGDPNGEAADDEDGGRHAPHHHAFPAGGGGPHAGELVLLQRCCK